MCEVFQVTLQLKNMSDFPINNLCQILVLVMWISPGKKRLLMRSWIFFNIFILDFFSACIDINCNFWLVCVSLFKKNRQKVRKTVTSDRLSQSLHRKVTSTKKPILMHMGFLIYFTVIQTCPSLYQENRSRKLRHIVSIWMLLSFLISEKNLQKAEEFFDIL